MTAPAPVDAFGRHVRSGGEASPELRALRHRWKEEIFSLVYGAGRGRVGFEIPTFEAWLLARGLVVSLPTEVTPK